MTPKIRRRDVEKLIIKHGHKVFAQPLLDSKFWGEGAPMSIFLAHPVYLALTEYVWNVIFDFLNVQDGVYSTRNYDCLDFSIQLKAACSRSFNLHSVGLLQPPTESRLYHGGPEPLILSYETSLTSHEIKFEILRLSRKNKNLVKTRFLNDEREGVDPWTVLW